LKNYSIIGLGLFFLALSIGTAAQTAVNTFTITSSIVVSGGTSSSSIRSHGNSVNGILPNTNYTVKYNNTGNVSIVDFTILGKTYVQFSKFDTVIIRRVANNWVTSNGNKQHIYCQGPSVIDNTTYILQYPVAYPVVTNYAYMERVMKEGYINRGSDNVFNNDSTSDLTHNNIERVDFVYKGGMQASLPASAGFLIAERGGNDPFKIAPILTIDASGNPTSFGTVLSVTTATYGAAMYTASTYVMRKDVADNTLRPFSFVASQSVKAVFIRFSDLGISSAQTVFGYALMANDVTASTSSQVLAYTNSTYFPLTTTTSNGGIDLASSPGIYHTDLILDANSISLSGSAKNCEENLKWTDPNYLQVKNYGVERSTDKINFTTLAHIDASDRPEFSFVDRSFNVSSFYRIRINLSDGNSFYSTLLYAKNNCSNSSIAAFPNPVIDQITVTFEAATKIDQIAITGVDGKIAESWKIVNQTPAFQFDVHHLPSGQYFIKFSSGHTIKKVIPILKR
jgi:hypothetical protein